MMLYLAQPNGALKWEDIPAQSTLEAAAKYGRDLSGLSWKDSTERTLTLDVLRVALRHGVACSAGLVVDAGLVVQLGHAGEIRRTSSNAQQARDLLVRENQVMEQISPGWTEHGRQLDAEIAKTTDKAIREAEEDAAEILAAPAIPALIKHWRKLGGRLPDPL
ncbi:hypothetical protein ACWKWC_06290 [Geodermatophilus nigrescens]